MDDRRRTISSEEQMIGEALMRVSNTLEAQRLTKSLDYQEKLRRRSTIRLIIAIVALAVAFMMVVVGGALLFILWRYADPVLDTVIPFLKSMFGDFGIIWDGLVESSTYVPVMVDQLARLMEEVITLLEGINRIDLAGMMKYLTNILGTTSGMLADLRGVMRSMMPMLTSLLSSFMPVISSMGKALVNLLNGDFAGLNAILSGFGIDMDTVASIMRNLMGTFNGLATSTNEIFSQLATLSGTISNGMTPEVMEGVKNGIEGALKAIGDGLGEINSEQAEAIIGGLGDAMQSGVSGLAKIAGAMDGLASLLERIGGLLK